MKIAAQMDHISYVNIEKDTTFALLLEAQKRGHELYHYIPDNLSCQGQTVYAHSQRLALFEIQGQHCHLSEPKNRDLSEMDVILLRQDPPFDMHYITTTFLLETLPKTTQILNDPFWVRNSPEKFFVFQFLDLMPETLITRDIAEVLAFQENYGDIILKPLYGNGGEGVFYLKTGDPNLTPLVESFQKMQREAFIVQRYLPEVKAGDKRILLLNGEYVGAINRVPNKGQHRSNMHAGGQAQPTILTARDKEICQRIGPFLKERGFLLVGIDVIGNYLTEINVTSPTGIQEVLRFGGENIAALFWDEVESRYAKSKASFEKSAILGENSAV